MGQGNTQRNVGGWALNSASAPHSGILSPALGEGVDVSGVLGYSWLTGRTLGPVGGGGITA